VEKRGGGGVRGLCGSRLGLGMLGGAMTIVDYRSFQGAAGDEVTGWRGRRLNRRRRLGGGRGHRVGGQVTQGG
jgi:hypothetical protein